MTTIRLCEIRSNIQNTETQEHIIEHLSCLNKVLDEFKFNVTDCKHEIIKLINIEDIVRHDEIVFESVQFRIHKLTEQLIFYEEKIISINREIYILRNF